MTNGGKQSKSTEGAVRLARAWLTIERYWPAFWPAVAVVGFYLALSLFDPWTLFPEWVHVLGLIAALGTAIVIANIALKKVAPAGEPEARRRVEKNSELSHRPLDAATDTVSGNQHPLTRALWAVYKNRISISPSELKAGVPHAGLHYRDPHAIRALLVLVAFIGIIVAGPDWTRRIQAAFSVEFADQSSPVRLDAWLQPPEYTSIGPQTLSIATDPLFGQQIQNTQFSVPSGTVFSARVANAKIAPSLEISGQDQVLTQADDGSFTSDAELLTDGRIVLRTGASFRSRWRISIISDRPPTVEFVEPPSPTSRNALRIVYAMEDDYGVSNATLEIDKAGFPARDHVSVPLAGTNNGGEESRRVAYADLAAHPWAGSSVTGTLRAEDAIGQTATSEPVEFLMPERNFQHPVARNLIAIRKGLYLTPARRRDLSRRLEQQALRRVEFDGDLAVYTALRSAYWRLHWNDDEKSRYEVMDLLWDTALFLEDGDVSLTETALRNMFEDALRALQDPNRADEFGDLTEQLSKLIDEYLAAQQSQADNSQTTRPDDSEMQTVGADVLSRLLQQMRDLAAAGRTEEAREILNALRNLLENSAASEMNAEAYEQMMEGARNLDALRDLADRQKDLIDKTARESMLEALRERLGGKSDGLQNMAGDQSNLAEQLAELQKTLDQSGFDVSKQLDPAGASMQKAATSLEAKDSEAALSEQENALKSLNQAAKQIDSSLSQQMAEMQQQNSGGDPLGRPYGADTDRIEIPDAAEMAEAQRLLQELRNRLGETSRPEDELEYLRRLLRRF